MRGQSDRWGFLDWAAKFAVGGVTAASHLDSLKPNYALAQKVAEDDARIATEYVEYPSPNGHDKTNAYLAKPVGESKVPGGSGHPREPGHTPYIEDVARRVGMSGFIALAPDILAPLGGYPGTDDEGRVMQRQLDQGKVTEDFIAAARYLKAHPRCTGKLGVVGFCFGGAGRTRWRQGFRT